VNSDAWGGLLLAIIGLFILALLPTKALVMLAVGLLLLHILGLKRRR
jgi:hypothetical protein